MTVFGQFASSFLIYFVNFVSKVQYTVSESGVPMRCEKATKARQ